MARLQRIRDLSHDLARELLRPVPETETTDAMIVTIKADIDAVIRLLKAPKSRR